MPGLVPFRIQRLVPALGALPARTGGLARRRAWLTLTAGAKGATLTPVASRSESPAEYVLALILLALLVLALFVYLS